MKFGKVYLLAILLVCVFVTGCLGGPQQDPDQVNNNGSSGSTPLNNNSQILPNAYTSDDYGFSIRYPQGWDVEETSTPVIITSNILNSFDLNEDMYIAISSLDGLAFDDYIQTVKDTLTRIGYYMISDNDLKVDNHNAHLFKMMFNFSYDQTFEIKEIIIEKGSNAYIIEFDSAPSDFDNFEEYFDDIVASFKFIS